MRGALLVCTFLLAQVGAARAFSDPTLFSTPASEGGGGGRQFTGSPLDGETCAVCHRGGHEPAMYLSGLPSRFEPGQRYDVTVGWQDVDAPHALQLELLDEHGASPELTLPDPVPAGARCDADANGEPASYVQASGARRIVGVRDCNARALHFSFVAPTARRLVFAATAVRSDSQGDSAGDGVSELRAVLYDRASAPAASGCNLGGNVQGGGLLALLVLLLWRVRARLPLLPLLSCCYQPDFSADYIEPLGDGAVSAVDAALDAALADPLDAGLADGDPHQDASTFDAAVSSRPSHLLVMLQTGSFGGRYAPRNIGAIWIEDAEGRFVKTLERWAGVRAMYLRTFNGVSGGDLTDALTSATLDVHQPHALRWDLTDVHGARVPRGAYTLALELTDRDGSGAVRRVPLQIGDQSFVVMPEDSPQFRQLTLSYE